jgi:hypothetical protein
MPSLNTISPDKLARLVGVPHGPALIDVRTDADFNADPRFVPGAVRRAVDIEGVFWSHRGERCTFDTMLDEFALRTEPLARLAAIVRGADTARLDLAPEAAGLLAASLGLSRMYLNDLEQLDSAMTLYDAFYRWCRDASDEPHDWPANAPKERRVQRRTLPASPHSAGVK